MKHQYDYRPGWMAIFPALFFGGLFIPTFWDIYENGYDLTQTHNGEER
ncbi:MAG: hypothetical protein LBV45_06355 [Xanthomonadaceae bacterium]|nr:hypothetical protein [Xanthomonadaceae bacterium]